jgi:hypothetical protein
MKHINKPASIADQTSGKASVVTFGVYAVLFGAWLLLQLQK